jgi:transposase
VARSTTGATARPTARCGASSWSRIAHDPETQLYFERRVKEGKTKAEVIRILKRYVARELYRYLPRG